MTLSDINELIYETIFFAKGSDGYLILNLNTFSSFLFHRARLKYLEQYPNLIEKSKSRLPANLVLDQDLYEADIVRLCMIYYKKRDRMVIFQLTCQHPSINDC